MYQVNEGRVQRNEGSTIPYTWIHSQPNRTLCIMLPGLGYTTKQPLFHYATGMCIDHHVDVLHVNYHFEKNDEFKKLTEPERNQLIYQDVIAVVEDILKGAQYEQCFLLSKSIGTIPMAMEWAEQNFIRRPFGIWLTPLLKEDIVYEALLKTEIPSLSVIGTVDHHYIEERVDSLRENEQINSIVIPKANHGLEITGDIFATIDTLRVVMDGIQEFLIKYKI